MQIGTVTPSGFSVSGFNKDYVEELHSVLEYWHNNSNSTLDFKTRMKVLKIAKELFGSSFTGFIKTLYTQGLYYGIRHDFIMDTLYYLKNGKRRVSTVNWFELLDKYPQPNRPKSQEAYRVVNETFLNTENSFKEFNINQVIINWCSHPKGFLDLLQSLEIMFGPERQTDVIVEKNAGGPTLKI